MSSFTCQAAVTFAEGVNVGNETTRIIHTVRSWTSPAYRIDVAATGSGRELALAVEITTHATNSQWYGLVRDIRNKLEALANPNYAVEVF